MRLTIRERLFAVVCLSLLPVALLGYLFVTQSQKDIAFASKELDGALYYKAVAGDLAALTGGGALPAPDAFAVAKSAFDDEMGSAERSSAYAALRDRAPAPRYDAETSGALLSLLAKIGDASNLILDPDLDSFYVMDMLVTKVPAAMDASASLAVRLGSVAAAPSDDGRIDLVAARGAFDALVAGTQNSLASGIAGNADGLVEKNLAAPTAAYATAGAALSRLMTDANAALGATGAAPEQVGKVAEVQHAFVVAAEALNVAVNAELSRLLKARIDGFNTRLTTMLGIAGALVLLVFAVCIVFIRSILKTIRRLEHDVRAVADQRANAEISSTRSRDEIAAIARAVTYLQEKTVERIEAADRLKAAGLEEAARVELDAARVREGDLQTMAAAASTQRRIVAALSESLSRLAAGDLACRIEERFEGELETLREAFNFTVDGLEDMVAQLRDNSSALRTATSEILAGSNDLADRTARQTSTIEQTSQSVRDVGEVVHENTDLVHDAAENGEAVSVTAHDTAEALTRASAAMTKISDSSSRISNIIGVIDDIAFQTNLLALNASVEAARAGDAGKGFAVVAVEVRRLAQSAASASADVKLLIEESGGYVAEGAKLVGGTTKLLEGMLAAAGRNGELLEKIAERSAAQAAAIEEIGKAFGSLEEMTQHNAALVQETNAAIEQTEAQANVLDGLVGRFRGESKSGRRAA